MIVQITRKQTENRTHIPYKLCEFVLGCEPKFIRKFVKEGVMDMSLYGKKRYFNIDELESFSSSWKKGLEEKNIFIYDYETVRERAEFIASLPVL